LIKPAGTGNAVLFAPLGRTGLTKELWARDAAAFEEEFPLGLDLPRLIRRRAEDRVRIPERAEVLRDN